MTNIFVFETPIENASIFLFTRDGFLCLCAQTGIVEAVFDLRSVTPMQKMVLHTASV